MNKKDFREEVNKQFLQILEKEQLDWMKTWKNACSGRQLNGITNQEYNGVNQMKLQMSSIIHSYDDPRWLTMVQIMDKDGKYHKDKTYHLKQGSKAECVEYWFPYNKETHKFCSWNEYKKEMLKDKETERFVLYPKYFYVFNGSCIEGLEPLVKEVNNDVRIDSIVEKLSNEMGVPISYNGGDRAYYSPNNDEIHLPTPESFINSNELAITSLHELAHSTGHESRLNREIRNGFGSEKYAMEELVAELTSVQMSIDLEDVDISSFQKYENNTAYLQSWISTIKEKPDALTYAVKESQKAVDYMEMKLGITPETTYTQQQELEKLTQKSTSISVTTNTDERRKVVEKIPEIDVDSHRNHSISISKQSQNYNKSMKIHM